MPTTNANPENSTSTNLQTVQSLHHLISDRAAPARSREADSAATAAKN